MKYLLYLLPLLFLIACAPVASPELQVSKNTAVSIETEPSKQTIRFLALGDSYTIGQGVKEDERWPEQLAVRLKDQGFDTELTIIARTGWTTENLLFSLAANPPQEQFDLVSILIGVNNQYRGWEVEEYRPRFRQILDQAILLAGGNPEKVIVISIPDWEVTPFAERVANSSSLYGVDIFNEVNLQESQTYEVRYVDITPISRRVTKDGTLLAPDGLHPSGEMYALWVEEMLPQIIEMLR